MTEDELDTLDVTRPTLVLGVKKLRERGRAPETESRDSFLSFLRAEGLIDVASYTRVTADEPVQVGPEVDGLAEASTRYEVFEKIAEGGMGEIRVARDKHLRHRVAMKLLKSGDGDEAALRRFVTEAQVTAQLDHPNIVPVYGLQVTAERNVAFAMKMVVGKTLKEVIRESVEAHAEDQKKEAEEHPVTARLEHFLRLCDAVGYAHSKGVLHRDLKPSNIMVGSFNELYVMDWGIARIIGDDEEPSLDLSRDDDSMEMTRADSVIGTPMYMSPEQARGGGNHLDARSDQYTLGLILFELVTLRRARSAEGAISIVDRAESGELEPVRHRFASESIDSELVAIIEKATSKSRAQRYPSVEALAADVRRYLRGESVHARPDNGLQALVRWMGRHRYVTAITLLGALLLLALVVSWSLYSSNQAAKRAHAREQRLTLFQASTAARASRIAGDFLQFEAMVVHLSQRTAELLGHGEPADTRHYSSREYDDPSTAPPGTKLDPLYGKPVHFEHPVYVLAPGLSDDTARPLLRRLSPLIRHFQWIVMRDDAKRILPGATRARATALTADRAPVRWTYVGLESGIMFSYPGKGGYPVGYDPRIRPWWKLGHGKRYPKWGNPYIDLQGQGLVLPCAVGIFADDGGRHGVAGIELTFDFIIRTHLSDDSPGEPMLLDERGRVVVRPSQLAQRHRAGELHDALELPEFSVSSVVDAIERRQSGLVEVMHRGVKTLVSYQRIPSLGWYYVVMAETARVLDRL